MLLYLTTSDFISRQSQGATSGLAPEREEITFCLSTVVVFAFFYQSLVALKP